MTLRRTLRSRRELIADVVTRAQPPDDAAVLTRLLEIERLAVDVYASARRFRRLAHGTRALFTELHGQEQDHVRALTTALQGLGAPVPRAPRRPAKTTAPAQLQNELATLKVRADPALLRDAQSWITLLQEVEVALQTAYYDALGRLADPRLATLAATILANEGQHTTVLGRLGDPRDIALAAPQGLVEGAPPGSATADQ